MNKSILIIDDDAELRKGLRVGLGKEGFSVVTAESAANAEKILDRISVGAIVLDRMMPGADGLSFLQNLRKAGDATPVMMLTAMDGGANAVQGLSLGADDYLAKPFHLGELAARLNNILRRAGGAALKKMPKNLRFKDGEFFIGKKVWNLSGSEKNILSEMLSGGVVKIGAMAAKRLRDKVLANLKNADIITIRGKGYKLVSN
ncbi:MAG: response regulator transcription factor [Rickettsiales bacterium]|jgi:DNA-binding response OmpR family regulator|nr:response regulator transcription factor [Rickettsiales bacterium]